MFICSVISESKQFIQNNPNLHIKGWGGGGVVIFRYLKWNMFLLKKVNFPVGLNWWGEWAPYSRTCGKSSTILKSQLSAVVTSSSQVLILVYTNIHSKYLLLFTFDWIGEVSIFNTLSYIVWEQLTSD